VAPSGARQRSHRPANAKGSRPIISKQYGSLLFPVLCHSWKASAGTRQRRRRRGFLGESQATTSTGFDEEKCRLTSPLSRGYIKCARRADDNIKFRPLQQSQWLFSRAATSVILRLRITSCLVIEPAWSCTQPGSMTNRLSPERTSQLMCFNPLQSL
jgi:hypothetical protein